MKKAIATLLAAGLLVGLSACSKPRPTNCVDFPDARAQQMLGSSATVARVGAVKSAVHEAIDGSEVYYVAIRFTASGHSDEGVWLSYDNGSAESLDAASEVWSGLPRSPQYSYRDQAADEAKRCMG